VVGMASWRQHPLPTGSSFGTEEGAVRHEGREIRDRGLRHAPFRALHALQGTGVRQATDVRDLRRPGARGAGGGRADAWGLGVAMCDAPRSGVHDAAGGAGPGGEPGCGVVGRGVHDDDTLGGDRGASGAGSEDGRWSRPARELRVARAAPGGRGAVRPRGTRRAGDPGAQGEGGAGVGRPAVGADDPALAEGGPVARRIGGRPAGAPASDAVEGAGLSRRPGARRRSGRRR
jgi:hypothetical protein